MKPCPHRQDGWCLICVKNLQSERDAMAFNFRVTNQAYVAQDKMITDLKAQLNALLLPPFEI